MRKMQLFMVVLVSCFLISCNDDGKDDTNNTSSKEKRNMEASHMINHAFETGDVSKLDSAVADDFLDHTERGDVRGRDSLIAMVKMVRQTNKDMKMEIIREVADDEYVFSWMHFSGTSDGTMMAAGPYDMSSIELAKFRDGKAIEHWSFMEPREMMKMMQNMQGMNPGHNMSTSDSSVMKK